VLGVAEWWFRAAMVEILNSVLEKDTEE